MRRAVAVMAAATALSVALRALVPINPIGLALASFDGGLFERLTVSLVHHDWLGKFDTTTLAKGPGYSVFLAAAYRMRLSVQVAEQIAYLLGASSIAIAVGLVSRRPGYAAVVYAVLAFDPVNYSSIATNITRENFYTSVALLFVGATFVAVYAAVARYPLWVFIVAGAVAGVAGAWFWITREEGVWVAGAIALIGAALVTGVLLTEGVRATVRVVVPLVVIAALFVAPVQWVKHKNARTYGSALVTDFADGSFVAAYAAWSRVRGVPLRDFVPVNAAQRAAVYAVSPAARKLEPYLEDPTNGWRNWGCKSNHVCDDFAGGGEPWAFRDAAASAGVFRDEPSFQRYFSRLADEINRACAGKQLQCSRRLPPSLQLVQRSSPRKVASSAWNWFKLLPAHFTIFESYNAQGVNKVPAAERRVIAQGVRHMPLTQSGAVRDAHRYEDRDWIFGVVRGVYRFLWKVLIPLAIVIAVASVFPGNRPRSWQSVVLAVALFVAVVTRLVIFGVVETTQYFGDMRYQLAAHSFLLAALVVLVTIAPEQVWVRWVVQQAQWRRRPQSDPGSV